MLKIVILINALLFPFFICAAQSDDAYVKLGVCTRVVDGDTIKVTVNKTVYAVRLIGVDTPETKHPKKPVQYFGKEASNFTKGKLLNKEVILLPEAGKKFKVDRYGRVLAYVWLNRECFNEMLIDEGYGFAYTKCPHRHLEKYRSLERSARQNKKGLWGKK